VACPLNSDTLHPHPLRTIQVRDRKRTVGFSLVENSSPALADPPNVMPRIYDRQPSAPFARVAKRSLSNHRMRHAMLAYLRILICVSFALLPAAFLSAHAQDKVEATATRSECERVCGQATDAKFNDQDKKLLDACIRQNMCAAFSQWWRRGRILLCKDCSSKPCVNCT
jgi:hypothetical protein